MALKINDNGTERNMTKTEEAEYLAWAEIAQAEAQALTDLIEAKAAARNAVLAKLGLSVEEAAVLLG